MAPERSNRQAGAADMLQEDEIDAAADILLATSKQAMADGSDQQLPVGQQDGLQDWSSIPNPVLKAVGNFLDINSCLASRLVCKHWCQGVSDSIHSLLLTPAMLAKYGPAPITKALQRLHHLEGIDIAISPSSTAATQRSCNNQHLQQLLSLVAQHGPAKLPAIFAFGETMQTARTSSRALQLPAVWKQSFKQGLAELGPKLTSLRVSDATLFKETPVDQLKSLEYLELNLNRADDIPWDSLAQLPALHSLMLSPPISPCSSGLGPEHAQQVVPTLLSFSIPVKQLLEAIATNPAVAGGMKQLLMQQTGTWDEPAVELLQEHFTGLEALRIFPGPTSPDGVWNNLVPASKMTKLKELQLVGYSPVNFSNGAATGESLAQSLKSLRTLELLIEPESDQVAAIAAITQLTRLKIMLQPRNVAEAVNQGAAIEIDLQGLLQELQGMAIPPNLAAQQQQQQEQQAANHLPGQQQQQQAPAEVAPLQQNMPEEQNVLQAVLNNFGLLPQPVMQQAAAAAFAAAGQAIAAAEAAGNNNNNVMVHGPVDQLGAPHGGVVPGGQQPAVASAAAAAATTGQNGVSAAAAPAASAVHEAINPGSISSSSGGEMGRGTGRSSSSSSRGLGRGLGKGLGLRSSSSSKAARAAAGNKTDVAASSRASVASSSAGSSCRRPVSSSRVAAGRDSSSRRRGGRGGKSVVPALLPASSESTVSSYALEDLPDLIFSSSEETSDDEQQQQQDIQQEGQRQGIYDSSSSSKDAAADAPSTAAVDAELVLSTATQLNGSQAPGTDSDGPPSLEVSDAGSASDHDSIPGPLWPPEQQQQQHLRSSDSSSSISSHDSVSSSGSQSSFEGMVAADAGNDQVNDPLLHDHDVAFLQQPVAAAAADGNAAPAAGQPAAAAANGLLQQQQEPPGVGVWGVPEGSIPSDLNCLDPLTELTGLKTFELLSPVIPITDSGVDPILVKGRLTARKAKAALVPTDDAAAARAAAAAAPEGKDSSLAAAIGASNLAAAADIPTQEKLGKSILDLQMSAALPELKSLTMSGAIHISRKTYHKIHKYLPDLENLILVHARPGDAPFDVADAAFGMEGLGPMGPNGIGGLAGLGGLGGLGNGQVEVMVPNLGDNGNGMAGNMVDVAQMLGIPIQANGNGAAQGGQPGAQQQQQGGEQQQQQQGAPGQQQQQQVPFGNFMQQILQQVLGPQAAAGAAGAAAAAAGQPGQPVGQQQQQQGIAGMNLPPGLNINIQIQQVPLGGGPLQVQNLHFPPIPHGGQHGQQQPGGGGGAAHQQQQQHHQFLQHLFGGPFPGAGNAGPAAAAEGAGDAADAAAPQQQPVNPLQHLFGMMNGPAAAAAAAAAAAGGNGPAAAGAGDQQGPPPAAAAADGWNHIHHAALHLPHHHHHHHHHAHRHEDPSDFIAPHKISVEDLPPGLKQLQLVNVGIKSSKMPLPCPKLRHLQIERCRSARSFRLPALERCTKLTVLQLLNIHLEANTVQLITSHCPHLQHLCLTDFKAFAASAPTKSVSRVMPWVFNQQQQGQQAAAAADNQQQQQQQPAGMAAGMVSEIVITRNPQHHGEAVDWSQLTSLRCLNQLSLKSSARHVVDAALQLGSSKHHVKTLKLEAQGLRATDLGLLGDQLVVLPHLTWLALVLQYRPERKRARPAEAGQTRGKAGKTAAGTAAAKKSVLDMLKDALRGESGGVGRGTAASGSSGHAGASHSSSSSGTAGASSSSAARNTNAQGAKVSANNRQQQEGQGGMSQDMHQLLQQLPPLDRLVADATAPAATAAASPDSNSAGENIAATADAAAPVAGQTAQEGTAAGSDSAGPAAAAGGAGGSNDAGQHAGGAQSGDAGAGAAAAADAGPAAAGDGPAGVVGNNVLPHHMGWMDDNVGGNWAWEPAQALSQKLAAELAGTALELRIRPHQRF